MFKRAPGTKDILPEQICIWQKIEEISRTTFSLYNYKEIRPPLIEEAALFNRSLGESTEIVQKQMFIMQSASESVDSSSSDEYALRPEATASIARAYIENSLDKTAQFVKLYYIGPMFRRERPQKGRLRQFHHIGCEAIGSQDADIDVEVIALADRLLKSFQIDGYKIKINSLGCSKDKKELTNILRDGLVDKLSELCEDCRLRFKHNILRILDCKNDSCRQVVQGLSINNKHLCGECKTHFEKARRGLDDLKINYEVSSCLVRGLDYYTRTVFEVTHHGLGPQQDALGAGGRYDNLIKELGGPEIGAIGFAFGVERLLLVSSLKAQAPSENLTYIITLGDQARKEGIKLLEKLRAGGIPADTDYVSKSLKGAMRKANDLGARFVLILGDNELEKNTVMLKDMSKGEQREVKIDNLIEVLMSNGQAQMSNG